MAADPLRSAREQLQDALPEHTLEARPPSSCRALPLQQLLHKPAPQAWLIADDLNADGMGKRWLKIARHLRRHRPSAAQTLLLQDWQTPWAVELIATGSVAVLPEVEGLTVQDALHLSGVKLCLSSDQSHAAAHATAHAFNLPLAYLV